MNASAAYINSCVVCVWIISLIKVKTLRSFYRASYIQLLAAAVRAGKLLIFLMPPLALPKYQPTDWPASDCRDPKHDHDDLCLPGVVQSRVTV